MHGHLRFGLGLGSVLAALSAGLCFAPDTDLGGSNAPNADGGAGADDTAVDDLADLVPEPRRTAADDGDDQHGEDDDDDDADLPENVRDDPKRLRTKLRRTQRQYSAARPVIERLRDPNTGKLYDARTVDTLLSRARDMEEMEGLFEKRPDLVEAIMAARRGDATSGQKRTIAQAETDTGVAFDEADLPFDATSDSGKFFAAMRREQLEDRKLIKQLVGRLDEQGQRESTRQLSVVEQTWKRETVAAANRLPEEVRQLFVNAVQGRYEVARRDRGLGRLNPREVIARELQPYATYLRRQKRGEVGDAARRANNNINRPGPVTRGTAPAGAGDSNRGAGTIRDARKSFFSRIGGSPAPGGRR